MVARLDQPTLRAGERAWFVRRDAAGALEWVLIKPFDDGSALVRTAAGVETYPPPNGPKVIVDRLTAEGFFELEGAQGRATAGGAEPPLW